MDYYNRLKILLFCFLGIFCVASALFSATDLFPLHASRLTLNESIQRALKNSAEILDAQVALEKSHAELVQYQNMMPSPESSHVQEQTASGSAFEYVDLPYPVAGGTDQKELDMSDYRTHLNTYTNIKRECTDITNDVKHTITKEYYIQSKLQTLISLRQKFLKRLYSFYESMQTLFDKGLLAKVDLLKVEITLQKAELQLIALQSEYKQHTILFNTMIGQTTPTEVSVEPLSAITFSKESFQAWLIDGLNNKGLFSPADEAIDSHTHDSYLSREETVRFRKFYTRIAYISSQIEIIEDIIGKATDVFAFQEIRFKNSLASSDEVLEALGTLSEVQEKRIVLLHDYHDTVTDAKHAFCEIHRKIIIAQKK
ncbi:MAG: TolC family protein [Candidatus Omnitrophica bacterium]|nr:TolC family protein [Candidatus Omnitrophota bacterium]